MTLFRLKSAPIILIEDDENINLLPLLLELTQEKNSLKLFCYEQPITLWKQIFKGRRNVEFYLEYDSDSYSKYTEEPCSIVVDSINQMTLCSSWNECLLNLKKLQTHTNIAQMILILHRDCLAHDSRLQLNLRYMANAIVSYDTTNPCKINVLLKKGGKILQSDELLSYDISNSTLKCTPIVKEETVEEEQDKPLPSNLSTFKIEVEQTEKIEKYKLKLPYMSKIHEGESKVYYEPDAVDDWDEEDPDEDLDI